MRKNTITKDYHVHNAVSWTKNWQKCESCEREFAPFRFVRIYFWKTGRLYLICDKCKKLTEEKIQEI